MILMKQTKQERKSTKQAKKGWNVILNQFGKNKDEKTLSNTFYLYHCSVPQKKFLSQRSLFVKWVSNEIQNNRCFVLLRSVIGPEDSRQSLSQTDAKLKPITTWSPAFSRALGDLAVFTLSSLAIKGIFTLSSDLPLWLLWFWLWDTQWKGVLIS